MIRLIYFVLLIVTCNVVYSATLTPKFKKVALQEFTSLILEIMPDAGTQLIFPFELDNKELSPALKIRLTNTDGFDVPHTEAEVQVLLKGQNTISILGKPNLNSPNAVYQGNLFITIGGYNLSIALKTTYEPKRHISNIIFDISQIGRDHLIENMVARKTKNLDKKYQRKLNDLDTRAKQMSLLHIAKMATNDSDSTNYKEDGDIEIDGKRIVVYSDRLISYGNDYFVLLFSLENYSSDDFTLLRSELTAHTEKGYDVALKGSFNCATRLNADTTNECTFATTDKNILTALRLSLSINTDRGEGSFKW